MDNLAVMVILGGLLMKLGVQLGIDPIQLGPIIVINFAVGMETPPLGYSLFVGSAISGLSIEEITKGMLPFFCVDAGIGIQRTGNSTNDLHQPPKAFSAVR